MGEIKCLVEECRYNRNQICQAGGIEVASSGDMKVSSSPGTQCSTFEPKEK